MTAQLDTDTIAMELARREAGYCTEDVAGVSPDNWDALLNSTSDELWAALAARMGAQRAADLVASARREVRSELGT